MAALTVTAANVVAASTTGGSVDQVTIGETMTAGQAVYLKAADNRVWLAQADGTAAEAAVVGVMLTGGGAGQIGLCAKHGSSINIGATTTKIHYYASPTAGGVGPIADVTSGMYITRIGYGTATDGSVVIDIRATGTTT